MTAEDSPHEPNINRSEPLARVPRPAAAIARDWAPNNEGLARIRGLPATGHREGNDKGREVL